MLILPAILSSFQSLKDKTIKLVFECNELTPEQLVGVAGASQEFGYLAFKKDLFKASEKKILEDLEADYDDRTKSPSKRLRNVLYVSWEQRPEGYEDFNLYYEFKMNKIIEHLKSKLD